MEVLPIDVTAVVATAMGILIVLIPVAGWTARFALKPVVEAIARVREAQRGSEQAGIIVQRLELLEQQLSNVESELHRLKEGQEFHSRLEAPRP